MVDGKWSFLKNYILNSPEKIMAEPGYKKGEVVMVMDTKTNYKLSMKIVML